VSALTQNSRRVSPKISIPPIDVHGPDTDLVFFALISCESVEVEWSPSPEPDSEERVILRFSNPRL
jgi:hypothetical protein